MVDHTTTYVPHPTLPHTYTRPLGLAELPMVQAITAPRPPSYPREPVRIHVFAPLTCQSTTLDQFTTALSTAWLALRLLHEPDIATTFVGADKVYTSSASPNEIETWLQRTFLVSSPLPVADVVIQHQSDGELLPLCILIPTQDSSAKLFSREILLLASHWRTEASGLYLLLDKLLTLTTDILSSPSGSSTTHLALAQHKPGSEISLLTPCAEDMLPSVVHSPNRHSLAETKTRIAARLEAHKPKLPTLEIPLLPSITDTTPSGPVIVQTAIYSADNTSVFVQACKTNNISVTAAVLASWVTTIMPLVPQNEGRWFASMMPAQVRSRLSSAANGINDVSDASAAAAVERWKTQGCWNAAQMMLISSPPTSTPPTTETVNGSHGKNESREMTLVQRAKDLQSQVAVANTAVWASKEEYTETSTQMAEFWGSIPAGSNAVPWFTSLGDLEKGGLLKQRYESQPGGEGEAAVVIEVGEVHEWADPVGMGMVLTMWTWKGRMWWQVQWNGAFHGREMVRGVLEEMVGRCREGLGLGQGWKVDEWREEEY